MSESWKPLESKIKNISDSFLNYSPNDIQGAPTNNAVLDAGTSLP